MKLFFDQAGMKLQRHHLRRLWLMLPANLLLVSASPAPTAPDPRIDIRTVGDTAFVGDWSEFAEPKEEDPSKGDPKAENQPASAIAAKLHRRWGLHLVFR